MSAEEKLQQILGAKDIQIAMLLHQLEETQKKVKEEMNSS